MKIAILHYHLKPGGVATVIGHQLEALAGHADVLLLTGAESGQSMGTDTAVIPGIGYDGPGQPAARVDETPEQTASRIVEAIERRWPEGCDIVHVHNPLLAKNSRFLSILGHLQQSGLRLLLQIHDFAEDGRPEAYYADTPYPADCHYCVLNSRDYASLRGAGLDREGLHLLPNMVRPFALEPEKRMEEKLILYPVRAIRRKNIGEAVLLSLYLEAPTRIAVTLPPNSPMDQAAYDSWRRFVRQHRLPVLFDASHTYAFSDLVQSAEALVTTSITEGFGFAFLEPWTAGQMLCGRRLPGICTDFEQQGLCLDHLYDRLPVPLAAFDADVFFHRWQAALLKNAARFGVSLANETIREHYSEMTRRGDIDFGLLDEGFQQQVIRRMLSDRALAEEIQAKNSGIGNLADIPGREDRIRQNRAAVLSGYSREVYRKRLLHLYEAAAARTVRHRIDKTRLALDFLHPETFSLLKWSDGLVH
jgi:glycosyltransferase involved in cell wall biosynthesis